MGITSDSICHPWSKVGQNEGTVQGEHKNCKLVSGADLEQEAYKMHPSKEYSRWSFCLNYQRHCA